MLRPQAPPAGGLDDVPCEVQVEYCSCFSHSSVAASQDQRVGPGGGDLGLEGFAPFAPRLWSVWRV